MMLRINLGSGQRPFSPPWVNVDSQARFSPDICMDGMEYLQGLPERSAEMIVLHHCAEHMTLDESTEIFRESHRVLNPGGSLLIFVPDLHALTHAWIEGRISDYIFCVNLHGAWMGDPADLHKWSFTAQTLSLHLRSKIVWQRVIGFDWRSIAGADIARDWWILGMESVR